MLLMLLMLTLFTLSTRTTVVAKSPPLTRICVISSIILNTANQNSKYYHKCSRYCKSFS